MNPLSGRLGTTRIRTTVRRAAIWLVLHAGGLGLYVAFSSREWIEPELRGVDGANGGGQFVFALFTLYAVVFMLLVNSAWAIIAVWRRTMNRQSAAVIALSFFAWAATIWFSARLV